MLQPIYDVFLSVSGADRGPGRELASELRALGLRVFLDEDRIEPFTSITGGIQEALRSAKALVAYYSTDYAARPACQRELMTAFLAGQQEGDPCGRIMVINPESDTGHLRPVELADARFAPLTDGVAEVARQVAKRTASLEGTIGEVPPARRPRRPAHRAGHMRDFTGRYRELWDLHTALHAADFPLIEETACGPFVSVCGLPGAGRTALVTTYARRFAAAFPGGICWVSLAGVAPDPDALRERYARELRRFAAEIDVDLTRVADDRVAETVARELRFAGAASLWVIDDIPDGLGPAVLDLLPLPAESGARTVLISEEDAFRDLFPVVRVGPLPELDAVRLLDGYRLPDSEADRQAQNDVVRGLGGNAGALVAVGRHLRDRHGLSSYSSVAAEIDTIGDLTDAVFGGVRRVLDRMGPAELALLRLADRTGVGVFPARLLAALLPGHTTTEVGDALQRLSFRSAASRAGAVWRLDPLVVHATRDPSRLYESPDSPETAIQGLEGARRFGPASAGA
ncbi:TIR domain-containing protein [Streptomyces sp. NPDC001388]|uniref:TIR domain-containing protein n=1 Tax=Streptomyces sp. NPDC001388 TaxID=3364568 RepID=UPI0036C338ED